MQEDGRPRFTPANLQSHLSPMFENLFLAFQKPESGENEYLMKCVMRVITFVGQEVRKAWSVFPAFSFCGHSQTLQPIVSFKNSVPDRHLELTYWWGLYMTVIFSIPGNLRPLNPYSGKALESMLRCADCRCGKISPGVCSGLPRCRCKCVRISRSLVLPLQGLSCLMLQYDHHTLLCCADCWCGHNVLAAACCHAAASLPEPHTTGLQSLPL